MVCWKTYLFYCLKIQLDLNIGDVDGMIQRKNEFILDGLTKTIIQW